MAVAAGVPSDIKVSSDGSESGDVTSVDMDLYTAVGEGGSLRARNVLAFRALAFAQRMLDPREGGGVGSGEGSEKESGRGGLGRMTSNEGGRVTDGAWDSATVDRSSSTDSVGLNGRSRRGGGRACCRFALG